MGLRLEASAQSPQSSLHTWQASTDEARRKNGGPHTIYVSTVRPFPAESCYPATIPLSFGVDSHPVGHACVHIVDTLSIPQVLLDDGARHRQLLLQFRRFPQAQLGPSREMHHHLAREGDAHVMQGRQAVCRRRSPPEARPRVGLRLRSEAGTRPVPVPVRRPARTVEVPRPHSSPGPARRRSPARRSRRKPSPGPPARAPRVGRRACSGSGARHGPSGRRVGR